MLFFPTEAQPDFDYKSGSTDLTFGPEDRVGDCRNYSIAILEDLLLERNETFSVTVTSTDNVVIVRQSASSSPILILDNDRKYPNDNYILCRIQKADWSASGL